MKIKIGKWESEFLIIPIIPIPLTSLFTPTIPIIPTIPITIPITPTNSIHPNMKKTILTLLLAAGLTITTTVHAQVLKFGVKGGINYSQVKFSNGELTHKDRSGFFAGPTLKIALPTLPIGFDISALYDEREFEIGDEMLKDTYSSNVSVNPMKVKLKQVAIPVNLRFTFGNSKTLALYLFGGPQFGFNINDKDPLKDQVRTWNYEDSDFSVNVGAGILLVNAVQVSFNYNIDCGKSGEMTVNDAYEIAKKHESKANAWQLGAAIYF